MSSATLDFDRLLAPIAGENPCGADLRWDPVYQEVKLARQEGDRDMLGLDEPAEANWPRVLDLTSDALATRTKDLMLACWLTEAQVNIKSFAGLRDSITLLIRMLEMYWEHLYPLMDEGDLEPRVAPLVWLTDADRGARLPNRLRDLPLLPGDENYSWRFWKSKYPQAKGESEDEDVYNRRRAEAEDRGKRFEDAAAKASRETVDQVRNEVLEAAAEVAKFDRLLDEKFGKVAPATTPLRQALEECEVLLRRIVREKGGLAGEAEAPAEAEAGANGHSTPASSSRGPITSREDAFRRPAEIADYLRRAEPQSPVSYLVDRAVSWGRMPFEQLLNELIRDDGVRGQVGELLGIRRNTESGST